MKPYVCNIRNIRFRWIILINFVFSIFYFGPFILPHTVYVIHYIAVTAYDEANALLFSNVDKIQWPTSTDLRSLTHANKRSSGIEIPAFTHNPPDQFKFIHRSFLGCKRNVRMLILIKSAAENILLRDTIRVSWGQKQNENFHIKFLLGMDKNIQQVVDAESTQNGDIIQKDFVDAYVNNTYKTMMGYDWAVRYCSHSEFILFVDDDYYVNKEAILTYVLSLPESRKRLLYLGMLYGGRPQRYMGSKWYVSLTDYPYPRYPAYATGGAYIISQLVARKFAVAFPFVKYFWIDDVWVGLVAMLTGISPADDFRFYKFNNALDIENRFVLHCKDHDPAQILAAWERNRLNK